MHFLFFLLPPPTAVRRRPRPRPRPRLRLRRRRRRRRRFRPSSPPPFPSLAFALCPVQPLSSASAFNFSVPPSPVYPCLSLFYPCLFLFVPVLSPSVLLCPCFSGFVLPACTSCFRHGLFTCVPSFRSFLLSSPSLLLGCLLPAPRPASSPSLLPEPLFRASLSVSSSPRSTPPNPLPAVSVSDPN